MSYETPFALKKYGIDFAGASVLDIASYTGNYTRDIIHAGAKVTCIDPSDATKGLSDKATVHSMPAQELLTRHPEYDKAFDVVTCFHLAGYGLFEQHRNIMPVYVCALKESGKLVVTFECTPQRAETLFKQYFREVKVTTVPHENHETQFDLMNPFQVVCSGPIRTPDIEQQAFHYVAPELPPLDPEKAVQIAVAQEEKRLTREAEKFGVHPDEPVPQSPDEWVKWRAEYAKRLRGANPQLFKGM